MLGLSGTLWYALFVYLCICICVFARLTHESIIFDTLEQSSFQKYTTCWVFLALCHMPYLCICVFVYLCNWIFVFARLTHVNIIFDTYEQSSFQEYTTCWVFLALRHMLYLCICVFVYLCICIFVFARLTHGNIIFDTLEQSSFQKYAICWVFPALGNALYLCICVFVFVYFCMRHLGISV